MARGRVLPPHRHHPQSDRHLPQSALEKVSGYDHDTFAEAAISR
jgi:hypothetical protein